MTVEAGAARRTALVLDGNSLMYRSFYAIQTEMTTASGQATNALFGFTSMVARLVKERRPDAIVVAFDRPEPTFRHVAEPLYKAQREASPDVLRQQMGIVRDVLKAMGITAIDVIGFEADDIIATVADMAVAHGYKVTVVTGDRDSFQLVRDPDVTVLYPLKGVSETIEFDEAGIVEKAGVVPALYSQYAALRGDPSDNLSGVPGVGEKTAAKLINTYGGLDGIFEHASEQTPKLRQSLQDNEPIARRNHDLMKLRHDVPLEVQVEEMLLTPDISEAQRLFEFLELKNPWRLWTEAMTAVGISVSSAAASAVELAADVVDLASAVEVIGWFEGHGEVVVAALFEGEPGRSPVSGLLLHRPGSGNAAFFVGAPLLADSQVASALSRQAVIAHDAKPMMRSLLGQKVDVRGLVLDTSIAAYLIDPSAAAPGVDSLVERYADRVWPRDVGASEGMLDFSGGGDERHKAALEVVGLGLAASAIRESLKSLGLTSLNADIETPLVRVLAKMEFVGIEVDAVALREIRDRLSKEVSELSAQLQNLAGGPFNPNSPAQLGRILFDERKLTPPKKTKTGYSTDAATLEKLRDEWPEFIDPLLRYRETEKLRGTYGEGLLAEVASDSRIHATFNQTVARTGRLSSDRPNLHNIPVRTDEGRVFRTAFVAHSGHQLLVADYNQIELRCIAHLADDPGLVSAFRDGVDVHRVTAARVFGVKPDEVTHDQRSRAKMVSYGLAYGMEAFGLSQRLGIGVDEASGILNAYFDAFPKVRSYMDDTVKSARDLGYTETLFGRRRRIPDIDSPNFRLRQAAERQAMNAGIQGLAADIFKIALVRVDRALEEAAMRSRIVLQVHDEVIVEVPDSEVESVEALVLQIMRSAGGLSVPMEVNYAWGRTWAAAKG